MAASPQGGGAGALPPGPGDPAAEAGTLQRLLARVARIEPRETTAVIASFFLFFFVLGSYFAVRPVRETIATVLGRSAVVDLWVYTALFAVAVVPVYGWLVGRVRRSVLLPCIYGAVAATLVFVGISLQADPENRQIGAFFYVMISVVNLFLVSVFWSFLLEIFSSEQTKRLFGFVAAGGTLGALVGPGTTALVVGSIGNTGILFMGAAGFIGAIFCQLALLTIWRRGDLVAGTPAASEVRSDRGLGGNPFAGVMIVLKSPYLLGIALFVMLLSAANTVLYFEQLRVVDETFATREEKTQVFAIIDFVVQSLTIATQVFLTGRIAASFGLRALLTVVPVAMMLGFMVVSAFNVFISVVVLMILRRWGEYALVRPGREMLFSRLDKETKYKAKNVIDLPVYRAADAGGAQVVEKLIEGFGMSPAGMALVGAGVAAGWALNGWWLGSRADAMEKGG
jgi:AAA family ATP:ADP antiporter